MDFVKHVQSMSAKDIILTMVEGLRNPMTNIDMSTFGRRTDNMCFGCAATNTICKILGTNSWVSSNRIDRHHKIGIGNNTFFLSNFENAIDHLRLGNIDIYNQFAILISSATIESENIPYLPMLKNNYTEEDLLKYENFANTLN